MTIKTYYINVYIYNIINISIKRDIFMVNIINYKIVIIACFI